MASNGTVAHRFANRNYNFERGLKGSSVHIDGRDYYSYSTVFGQWVDEKVCIVYHGGTSPTSNKHKLWGSDFPKDVTLFPYDDGGSGYWNSWHGCDLLGWRGEFDYNARVKLIDYWVGEIYDALHAMVDGKSKDLDKHAEHVIAEYWAYVEKLCSMYKDTSVYMWLKKKRIGTDGEWKAKKTIVKALYKSEREVRVLVDAAFGQGTYKKYYEYCARYRKAEDNKAKMIDLCHRLGMSSPYRDYYHEGGRYAPNPYSTKEIRKMTAKQRVELHFSNLMKIESYKHEDERKKKYEKNKWNAYRWIVGCNPQEKSSWYGKSYDDKVVTCRNMFTREEYDLSGDYIYGFYWCDLKVEFDYYSFQKSENKEEWIRNFYSKCKEVQDNRRAISILKMAKANTKEKAHSYDDDIYLNDAHLRMATTDEEFAIVSWFIERQDKHYADEEARKRAMEIERQRQAEEKRREEEYRAKVKQEQIDACLERGVEGERDLWRLHLTSIYDAESHAINKGVFYYGGNVLLRLNLDKTHVESSKNVRVPVAVAKAWFRKVKQWHENPSTFTPMEWNTKGNGTYTVSEYKNDILTAGCHDIAYAEMERMYNQICAETA